MSPQVALAMPPDMFTAFVVYMNRELKAREKAARKKR